jgi:F0F1-type ATP synthase epsilon subunit
MPKSLKVKIFVADRTVYQGKARTIALRFFSGNLEVMSERREYYTSFDRGTITLTYGTSIVQYDLNLGFASSTRTELIVLADKAKRITPEFGKTVARTGDQDSGPPKKKSMRALFQPMRSRGRVAQRKLPHR